MRIGPWSDDAQRVMEQGGVLDLIFQENIVYGEDTIDVVFSD